MFHRKIFGNNFQYIFENSWAASVISGSSVISRGGCTPFSKNRPFLAPGVRIKEVCWAREATTVLLNKDRSLKNICPRVYEFVIN
tara:strand:- start:58 stop:312 length:255 start_codon:yes stop_codon:yes gene_type:complete